jgi:hypothetical protein
MRRLILLLLLAVVLVACDRASAPDQTTTSSGEPATTESLPATTTAEQPTTTESEEMPDVMPLGLEDLSPSLRTEVLELVALTQELRELRFLEAPVITVVDDEELARRVRESIEEEVIGIEADQALYSLLGLIAPETDLLALYSDLYGEQVAGFYDGDEGELVIPSGDLLSPLQRSTLIHELTHALTDQHFDMSANYEALVDEERFDEASAYLSVIEGDATLTEILYIQDLPLAEQQELISESLEADSSTFDAVPQFIQDSLIFPYQEGFVFTQRLFELGGFFEIEKAYSKPPVSTEQIIEPRDFGRDLPIDVAAPTQALDGYELIYDSVWGELGFDTMFDQILGEDASRTASDGWGGDRYSLFFDGTESALVLNYRGDSERDAEEMQAALLDYIVSAMAVGGPSESGGYTTFSGDDFAAVLRDGDAVTFVAASDPGIGASLLDG